MWLFGERIKRIRTYLGLTQGEFAVKIGVTLSHISGVENGDRGFNLLKIKMICDTFKIDARFIFGQIDSIEGADLTKQSSSEVSELIKTIREQELIIQNMKKMMNNNKLNELSIQLSKKPSLCTIIEKIMYWNPDLLRGINTYITAVELGRQHPQ